MVSSSQSHRLDHKLKPENKPTQLNQRDTIRICKGPKPLAKTSFYLDINNHGLSVKIESKLKELGAKIEVFLDKTVRLVVSDRTDKTAEKNKNGLKWDCFNGGGSGGPPSLSSIQVPTPVLTPSTPYLGNESPLSNSTNIRGQTTQRHKSRVDAMLERALTQPQHCSVDPLSKARDWAIPIWPTDKLLAWLDKIYKSINKYKQQQSNSNDLAKRFSSPKVTHLKKPFIKFEPYARDKKAVYLELPSWPSLNFDGEPGSCPFVKKNPVKEVKKENRENAHLTNKQKEKEMTRRPRATATRARKSELVSGYCEICRSDYKDLNKHLQSEQHLKFVQNNDNFLSLDKLIHTGASVQAFLKLNQTKHVHKDCKLFSNGDRDLITDKSKKGSKADLSFTVDDEIEMVQCNGTRRELSLNSLTSAHNLRTRAKHESGHMLRSKGRSWEHEDCPNDKSYNNLEGFIITKRAKGTIWLEEEDDNARDSKTCNNRQDNCSKFVLNDLEKPEESNDENEPKENAINSCNNQIELKTSGEGENKRLVEGATNKMKINGYSDTNSKEELKIDKPDQLVNGETETVICNGVVNRHCTKSTRSNSSERGRNRGRRGSRSTIRGRPRLSVEERLIADNRAYYKVEVLGNKLRSSAIPNATMTEPAVSTALKQPKKEKEDDAEEEEEEEVVDEQPSSEKPVVVRFKRVRKSELSLLSDEAESFMFREPKREDSSELSEDDCTSVLPKDTESDVLDTKNSTCISSSEIDKTGNKNEGTDDDSQDSLSLSKARKKRRTQAEALIKDNEDYYKFETPGSRLRYQAPINGVKDAGTVQHVDATTASEEQTVANKPLSSSPSARIEKMHFSFESVPKSEPWYQTYQRQDEGAEYWHYFSESDAKPFLLPYEIENFREIYLKNLPRLENTSIGRGRGRGRGRGKAVGSGTHIVRSPRKSPRCHASTLAIMSTIIRKREQQHDTALSAIEEEPTSCTITQIKSEIENELLEIQDLLVGKNDEEMDLDLEIADPVADSFEVAEAILPRGAPLNLLELLDNCHAQVPILDHEPSGPSSECGETVSGQWSELPLRRRKKKRKNKTGWPGNRMRRKYSLKQTDEKPSDDVKPHLLPVQLQNDKFEQEEKDSCLKTEEPTETTQNTTGAMSDDKDPDNSVSLDCKKSDLSKAENIEVKESLEERPSIPRLECEYAEEARESSPVNDENHHENVENRKRKRPRTSTSCDDVADSYHETENEYSSNYEDAKRQNSSAGTRKRSQFTRKRSRQRARKRPRKRVKTAVDLELENECNKTEFCENSLTINNSSPRKGARRTKEDSESELRERMTPTVLTPTELVQKRSSMEFQPVVRVMKIDERVDIEHSIRSVAVASNRRLRSSASAKSNLPPSRRKRHRNSRGQLQPRRWMKNS